MEAIISLLDATLIMIGSFIFLVSVRAIIIKIVKKRHNGKCDKKKYWWLK